MENEKSRSAWAAMKYSIIIPVYNRPDEVDELLESLTRQTVKDFEVVVVEDGSTVPCKEVVEKYRAVDSSQFTADSSHADEEKLSTVNSQLSTLNSQLYFDLLAGTYCDRQPSHAHFLRNEEARVLPVLFRMNYPTMHLFRLSRRERQRILHVLNEYYRLHVPGFPELKSLEILQELFS